MPTVTRQIRRSIAIAGFAALIPTSGAMADLITLAERQHGTLYENPGGELANGLGQYFFAGNTNQSRARRGLLAFDLAPLQNLDVQINSVTASLGNYSGLFSHLGTI